MGRAEKKNWTLTVIFACIVLLLAALVLTLVVRKQRNQEVARAEMTPLVNALAGGGPLNDVETVKRICRDVVPHVNFHVGRTECVVNNYDYPVTYMGHHTTNFTAVYVVYYAPYEEGHLSTPELARAILEIDSSTRAARFLRYEYKF